MEEPTAASRQHETPETAARVVCVDCGQERPLTLGWWGQFERRGDPGREYAVKIGDVCPECAS